MRKIVKAACFFLVFASVYILLMNIFRWKDYHYQTWPNSATVSGFYKMKKNTVDVIFLGSSQGVTGFDPQVLYDEYSIASYNLSTEQQSLVISYFLLKEALKYQKPSAVILDVWMCYGNQNPLNSAESCVRKVIDEMKWSPLKIKAINKICRLDPNLKKSSFYFLNVRYHDRWKSLAKTDFEYRQLNRPFLMKGYAAESIPWRTDAPEPLHISEPLEGVSMQENMQVYLEKIVNVCKENNISLLLVKTPNLGWNLKQHFSMKKFTDECNTAFYDFNIDDLYGRTGYDYAKDGEGHLDNSGAHKVTAMLGNILLEDYSIPQSKEDAQWEDSRDFAQSIYQTIEKSHQTN